MSGSLPVGFPRVLAHRCGGALAPENTLAGLQTGVLVGCRGVEFDVMLSADGTPFVIHDETLERTTTGSGKVCESSDAVLRQVDAGIKHHPAFAGEKLPTFEQMAVSCCTQGLAANVEIKPATGYEKQTGEVVARMAARIWGELAVSKGSLPPLLSSFSEEALLAAALAAPHLPRVLLVEALPHDWLARCERLGAVGVHLDSKQLNQDVVKTVQAARPWPMFWVGVYTENAPERAQALWAWGVDVVITDRPDRVRG